jgi:transposase
MKKLTFKKLWQNETSISNIGVFGTSTSFFLEEARECADSTIMISGFFPSFKASCPCCGSNDSAVHRKNRHAHARMPTVNGHPAILRYRRNSFKCNQCGRCFTPPVPEVSNKHKVTTSLQDQIQRMASDHSFTQIEREVGVHRTIACRIFTNHSETVRRMETKVTPSILGIDSLHLGDSLTVLTDLDNHSTYDLWPVGERSKNARKELRKHFSRISHPENVKAVVIDMSYLLRKLTRKFLSGTAIIIDKWHVLRMHERHFQKWSRSKKLGYRKALRRLRGTSIDAISSLSAEDRTGISLDLIKEQQVRGTILGKFYLIYQAKNREEAEERFEAWRSEIERHNLHGYKYLIEFTYRCKKEILAYFDFNQKYTAAFTESTNGLLKARYVAGRGYRFESLRRWALVRNPSCRRRTFRASPQDNGSGD